MARALKQRRCVHVPETGYLIIIPTEQELIELLATPGKDAKRALSALFEQLGLGGARANSLPPRECERLLREKFFELSGRRISHTLTPRSFAPRDKRAPYSADEIESIKRLTALGIPQNGIARLTGLNQGNIGRIANGSTKKAS